VYPTLQSNYTNVGGELALGYPNFNEPAAGMSVQPPLVAPTQGGGDLMFWTKYPLAFPNEVMRITATGCVGIGQFGGTSTAPTFNLQLKNDNAAKPSTSTWTISSDERLKEDIVPANLDICYSNIKQIPLKYYKWKDDVYSTEEVEDRHKLGWIAQDVENVFSKAITKRNMFGYSDCRNLNTDQLYATMYGAVQKLQSMVESQDQVIQTLSAKVEIQADMIRNYILNR
jgi:hypothetical protein